MAVVADKLFEDVNADAVALTALFYRVNLLAVVADKLLEDVKAEAVVAAKLL